jgi:hypothetical protein
MYPDDEKPNQNSLGEPPVPVSLGGQGNSNSSNQRPKRKAPSKLNMRWLLIGAGGFLVLLLIAVTVIALASRGDTDEGQKKTATNTSSEETEEKTETATGESRCTAKERRYQNESLSLGFCYPNAWGNVSVHDAKFDPSDDGTRLKLSFSEKPQVNVGLVSDSWSTDAARDGVCSDPAKQELPDFTSFSARWDTEGEGADITSATRGLEIATDEYIIEEYVDNLLTNGVCITGFNLTNGEVYRHAEASYSAGFSAAIPSPSAHINDPTELVPVADRTDFTALVKSMYSL